MGAKPAYREDIPRVRVRYFNSSIIPGITTEDDLTEPELVPPSRVVAVAVATTLACRVRISSNGAVTIVATSRAVDPATSGMNAG